MSTRTELDPKQEPLTTQVAKSNTLPGIIVSPTMADTSNAAVKTPEATQKIRESAAKISIGQPAVPSSVIINTDGSKSYLWCTTQNPDLEDGVCEAILSIASNPSSSNPHLSKKVLEWLSLLPSNSTLTMDESSWIKKTQTSGEMLLIMQTSAYGDIGLRVFMDKVSGVWVVSDGQIL